MIQAVRTLLVTNQNRLQERKIRPAEIRITELRLVSAREFHLDLIDHVIRDVSLDSKTETTETEAIFWVATVEVGDGIIVVVEAPRVEVHTTADFHG